MIDWRNVIRVYWFGGIYDPTLGDFRREYLGTTEIDGDRMGELTATIRQVSNGWIVTTGLPERQVVFTVLADALKEVAEAVQVFPIDKLKAVSLDLRQDDDSRDYQRPRSYF